MAAVPSSHTPGSAATKLRARLEDRHAPILVCPGVYDGFSARIALEVGFEALYMTGAGTSASLLGHADLGIANLHDMRSHAEMIANLDPSIPLIADADTGYGGPILVARTVQSYARSGVAALHLEDQVQTKRCGHLAGKELVPQDVYLSRIRAAVAARHAIASDLVIIARTDALQSLDYDAALARLAAARDAGADVAFLEGVRSAEEAARAVAQLAPWPCLLNMVYRGATPEISVPEAAALGFRVVIFPLASLSPAYGAIRAGLLHLKREGRLGEEGKMTPREVFEVVGLKESLRLDAEAGGVAFAGGV